MQLAVEHNWDDNYKRHAEALCDMPAQFGLHKSMFLTTLRNMGTDEQREAFLKPAEEFKIIGCYAQTELGHGSNVQGLETTCTYDDATQEFVVHSPSMTAAKWWIGGLGRTADHAVVMAQLIVKGKRRGPHPIIVQIRDIQTREPLPGRIIGDIGPKQGYNGTDNGFLLLDNVRVPHFNMLARYAKVELDTAVYVPPKSAALTYGTLSWVRANIVQEARSVLMRATTIAVRYCAIRRQFADRDAPKFDEGGKKIETQVLDYSMVQYRVLPILATAFAFHCESCSEPYIFKNAADMNWTRRHCTVHVQRLRRDDEQGQGRRSLAAGRHARIVLWAEVPDDHHGSRCDRGVSTCLWWTRLQHV